MARFQKSVLTYHREMSRGKQYEHKSILERVREEPQLAAFLCLGTDASAGTKRKWWRAAGEHRIKL